MGRVLASPVMIYRNPRSSGYSNLRLTVASDRRVGSKKPAILVGRQWRPPLRGLLNCPNDFQRCRLQVLLKTGTAAEAEGTGVPPSLVLEFAASGHGKLGNFGSTRGLFGHSSRRG